MNSGSTAAVQLCWLLNTTPAPTVDVSVNPYLRAEAPIRALRTGTVARRYADSATIGPSVIDCDSGAVEAPCQVDRETTELEHIAGDLRRWGLFQGNWDGEGAAAPNRRSIGEAVAFVSLLRTAELPAPMLHSSGHAGLFWKTAGLYADLEFLGDARVAYYIERNGDKHKGVLNFDKKTLPAVLETILTV